MFLFVKLGIQTLMESHKASFFHEQIYLENFQFIKYSSFTIIMALTNLLQLLKPTQFQPPFLKKCLQKETKIKRFTKRYGEKYDKKIFLSNLDSIFLNCFGFLRTKTFKRRKNSPMNVHVNQSTQKYTISRCELPVDNEWWTVEWRRDMRTSLG